VEDHPRPSKPATNFYPQITKAMWIRAPMDQGPCCRYGTSLRDTHSEIPNQRRQELTWERTKNQHRRLIAIAEDRHGGLTTFGA
jgi:hypothetical protein